MMEKRALLIAGGGAIGTYVAEELLKMGHKVDVICLEEHPSTERIHYYCEKVDMPFLQEFLQDRRYDAIVNFLCYGDPTQYPPFHELLTQKTDQLVYLSSYRVYADEQHPLTESAPLLYDVVEDRAFLEGERYGVSKTINERYIRSAQPRNWTIVRPVISFASSRFDVVLYSGLDVIHAAREGKVLPLPEKARKLCAGLDWAGNSGKIIAHLLFKPETLGETYTISSGQGLTWEEIAQWYTELLGVQFQWIDTEVYKRSVRDTYRLIYDRLFHRDVDCAKVLTATGLTQADFVPVRKAIQIEVEKFLKEQV